MNEVKYFITGMSCGSCAMRIEKGMGELPEVDSAHVDFGKKMLTLTFADNELSLDVLQQYIAGIGGYDLHEELPDTKSISPNIQIFLWGIAGALGIAILFYSLQALGMQSFKAPIGFSVEKWYFVFPLIVGFGIQMGLFRAIHLKIKHGGGGMLAASGGVSTTSMIACCMHNLVVLFPILVLSGLAVFFSVYQDYVFGISLLFVIGGVAYMTAKYRKINNKLTLH